MILRNQELDVFIGCLKSDIDARVSARVSDSVSASVSASVSGRDPVRLVAEKIMGALQVPKKQATVAPARQSVAAQLESVVEDLIAQHGSQEQMTQSSSLAVKHMRALVALADQLVWWRRADAAQVGEPFSSGHANAIIIGKGGLEERNDVTIGVTLLLPGIEYPENQHPPEEVYVVLSPGQWQQEGGQWHDPGNAGLVHNPPNVLHSMRSGPTPLLTTWCLWTGTE